MSECALNGFSPGGTVAEMCEVLGQPESMTDVMIPSNEYPQFESRYDGLRMALSMHGRAALNYYLTSSNAIHISCPNEADRKAAAAKGVDPGGLIMIHGQRNWPGWMSFITQRFNWTDGCIAVTNSEMDEFRDSVPVTTRIGIRQ